MLWADAEPFKYGVIPEEVDKEDVVEVIVTAFEPVIDELYKAFEFFSSTSNTQVEKVFLAGGGALIPGVDGLLADRLSVPVEIFDPMESVKIPGSFDKKSLAHMAPASAVVMGLAARRFDYIKEKPDKKEKTKEEKG